MGFNFHSTLQVMSQVLHKYVQNTKGKFGFLLEIIKPKLMVFQPMFEPVNCHTFITESTFGLPVFQWEDPQKVHESINEWWAVKIMLKKQLVY